MDIMNLFISLILNKTNLILGSILLVLALVGIIFKRVVDRRK